VPDGCCPNIPRPPVLMGAAVVKEEVPAPVPAVPGTDDGNDC